MWEQNCHFTPMTGVRYRSGVVSRQTGSVRSHHRWSGDLPRGRAAVSLSYPCALALGARAGAPSGDSRRHRRFDWAGHFGLHLHLVHQRAADRGGDRLASRRDLLRPAPTTPARHRLGGPVRCHRGDRLHAHGARCAREGTASPRRGPAAEPPDPAWQGDLRPLRRRRRCAGAGSRRLGA